MYSRGLNKSYEVVKTTVLSSSDDDFTLFFIIIYFLDIILLLFFHDSKATKRLKKYSFLKMKKTVNHRFKLD